LLQCVFISLITAVFLLWQKLASSYEILSRAYSKVVDVMHTGKRLLGKYFRVAFFGQAYFGDEDGKEYVYKEPKITGLTEICERLSKIYSDKFGRDKVSLIRSSNKVKYWYIICLHLHYSSSTRYKYCYYIHFLWLYKKKWFHVLCQILRILITNME